MTDTELVEYSRTDRIATISLNRPDKLNAFNDEMVIALGDALRTFDHDDDAWVAVLHGRGRAFSSGADVRQRQLRDPEQLRAQGGLAGRGADSTRLFTDAVNWKPVVAAVHGYAFGLGLGIALQCDLVVAADNTLFQVLETGRGLPAVKYHDMLVQRTTGTFAADVVLTGRRFDAAEARAHDLVNSVVAGADLLDAAAGTAAAVAANPPLGVRASVRHRRRRLLQIHHDSAFETDPLRLHLSEDFRESAHAFAEKRAPRPYRGR